MTLTQTNSFWLKLIHSHLTLWWQPSWILPSWIWPSWILPSQFFLSNTLTLAKISSHHYHKKNFTHSFWLNLMIAAILKSAILDSAILCKKNFTQSFNSTWWWQPSWTLSCWIQTLPYWIQTPCYLLSDSLKDTLPPLWPWLKLIQSD